MGAQVNVPFCARCGHSLTTHALNRRAFSECSECGPCAFVPVKIGSLTSNFRPAMFFLGVITGYVIIAALVAAGRFIQ